ncbi:glycosyltransferase 87 family protein [Yinghuangia soli]|uniref:Glycosyltransferase 87 family protein n=1 Tax=Yinghuangia soli TaxID=2908204 RepID=A0AA41U1G5_9ACTN|nr:glycosyltransferase 87 family protein [Yinghuangia soli]MCF2527537.1 glycosyltransferase 87 family protein [Yinghuangia soli]
MYRPRGNRTLSARLWLPLGLVLAAAAATAWVWTVRHQPDWLWRLIDLQVYDAAGDTLQRSQHRLYTRRFGDGKLPFIYPPFAALVFYKLPFAFGTLKLFVTGLSAASLVAVVWASWGMLGYRRDLGRAGATLVVAAVALWLEPVQQTLIFGQVNLILMAAVVLDLAQPDARWWKGVGIGLATGFKLTPAIFVVYLLLTRRFRAAAVAAGTFAATVLGAWALVPRASRTFWSDVMGIGDQVGQGFISNQSLNGMLRRVFAEGPAEKPLWLLLAAATAVLGMGAAVLLSRQGRELAAVLTCAVTGLLVSPISWTHHWVWVVPALVLAVHLALTRARTAGPPPLRAAWPLLPLVLALLAFAWPMSLPGRPALTPQGLLWRLPYDAGREHHWTPVQFLAGNAYVFAGLLIVGLAARTAWRGHRAGAGRGGPHRGRASAGGPHPDTLEASVPTGGRTP